MRNTFVPPLARKHIASGGNNTPVCWYCCRFRYKRRDVDAFTAAVHGFMNVFHTKNLGKRGSGA